MDLESEGFVKIAGKSLEYRWLNGAGPGRPVLVLLHEGLGSTGLWKDFPDRLAEVTNCNVFVYSRAGYGKSDPVDLPRPLTYMHEEGEKVLPEILGLLDGDLLLIGHSDGASIALINAGSQNNGRLKGLILMAPHVFTEPVCISSIKAAGAAYSENDRLRNRLALYHDNVDNAFRGWCDAWLDPGFLSWNIESYLKHINVPVLVIQGEDDQYGTAAQVHAVCEQVSGRCDHLFLPDCRHSPHRDQPALTLGSIGGFIECMAGE